MGASASKASRATAGAARKYPTRAPQPAPPSTSTAASASAPAPAPAPASRPPPPTTTVAPPRAGPTIHPAPRAHTSRSSAVNLDGSDPDFAASLRTLGPVQPNPTLSPSSSSSSPAAAFPDPRANPALAILAAREHWAREAEEEAEALGTVSGRGMGKRFLDVQTVRRVLELRDGREGRSEKEIERVLGLREGVVGMLGGKGVVGVVDEVGRAEREIRMV